MNNNKRALQTFGESVRAAREKKKLTQTELANRLGCHQNSVRNVEQSGRCSKTMAAAIAKALHVVRPAARA